MAGEVRIGGSSASVRLQGNDTISADQTFTFPNAGGELVVATTRPFFYAKCSQSGNVSTRNDRIVYDQALYNVGNLYDPTTSIITAPQDGIYQINGQFFAGLGLNETAAGCMDLYFTNSTKLSRLGREFEADNYSSYSIAWSGFMSQGDTAYCRNFSGNIHTHPNYSFFSGYLVS